MVYKVFIQHIAGLVRQQVNETVVQVDNLPPNLNIRVKCTETQDEYRGQAFLNSQYLDKCQRWVSKGKFECITMNNNTEMELKVQIFKFQLKRDEKTDLETLK